MTIIKQLFSVGLLAAAGYGGYLAYQHYYLDVERGSVVAEQDAASDATPVDLVRAGLARAQTTVEAVGTTLARRSVEIKPLASGRVDEIHFEPGQVVAAGEPLVTLDDDIQRADLAEAEASLNEASLALERARTLRQSSTVSQADLETLISRHAIARAALDRARRRLEDRQVKAPFDGVTGLARIDPGAIIDDDTVITTLDDRREIDIEFSLPETLYGRIDAGLPVTADAAAFPGRVFDGTVVSIDTRIDAQSRSFKVRARLPNPDLALPAGMFMHLAVVLEVRNALIIPEEAVVAQGSETYVWVAGEDDRATRRSVSLGQRELGTVEVTSGLREGERVVVRGVQRVRDGASLRVISEIDAPRAPGGGGPA